jgi:hypothetical protein
LQWFCAEIIAFALGIYFCIQDQKIPLTVPVKVSTRFCGIGLPIKPDQFFNCISNKIVAKNSFYSVFTFKISTIATSLISGCTLPNKDLLIGGCVVVITSSVIDVSYNAAHILSPH